MDALRKAKMESLSYGVSGWMVILIGIVMFVIALIQRDIALLVRSLAFVALGLGYRYLAVEKVINFKLNVIYQNLVPEKGRQLCRFSIIGNTFKWIGNFIYCCGIILLGLIAFKYLPFGYLDTSIGLEATGLIVISIAVMYRVNDKLDYMCGGICDIHKDLNKVVKKLDKVGRRVIENDSKK